MAIDVGNQDSLSHMMQFQLDRLPEAEQSNAAIDPLVRHQVALNRRAALQRRRQRTAASVAAASTAATDPTADNSVPTHTVQLKAAVPKYNNADSDCSTDNECQRGITGMEASTTTST